MAVIIGLGELQVGKMRFQGLADLEGEILQIRGREVTVRENLEEVAGRTAILNGSDGSSFGIEIVTCARVDGLTRVILAEDPCLTRLASTNDWEHTSYPGTAFKPPLTYRISRPVEYSLHSLCV